MFDEFTNNLRLLRPENPTATMIKDAKTWIDECTNFNHHLDTWEEEIISLYKDKQEDVDLFQTDKEITNKLLEKRLKFILTFSTFFNDELDYSNCDCVDHEDNEHYGNCRYYCTCKFCDKDGNSDDYEEWTIKVINGVTYNRNVYHFDEEDDNYKFGYRDILIEDLE